MVYTDLITGFLGSGKTTFIRHYARYLVDKGRSTGILENDYGAINVDMMLLKELLGDRCELEMVIGGDYDCHRRRFKTKLISMGMSGYDRVVIEPSGIYDVDEFFDVLYEEPLDRWYRPGNVIAVVDAAIGNTPLSKESDYLLMTQVADAGLIVLSRVQEASEEDISRTMDCLNRVMEQFGCSRRFSQKDILCRDWEELTEADLERIAGCGYVPEDHVKLMVDRENGFSSLFYMNVEMPEERLRQTVDRLFSDGSLGHVIRVKGFVPLGEGRWLSVNATDRERQIRTVPEGQAVIIVIGEGLDKAAIDEIWPRH